MKLAALLLAAVACVGQSLSLSVSPASVAPGGTATLTLNFADTSPTADLAGIEWIVSLPAGVTAGAAVVGAAGTAAGKLINCGATGICIVIGNGATVNDTGIASGALATVPLTVAPTTAPGTLSIALSGVSGATGPGLAAMVTTSPINLKVTSKYDLNGDGVDNLADVLIILGEALGTSPCTAPSTGVGDGKCTMSDVELEIEAALGKIQ
jgi:hypothetical protein